jgi:multisubunit Na+/H+ antiporter MnhB subunit
VSAGLPYDAVLAMGVVLVALWSVAARHSFNAIVAFVAYGVLLALVWVQLGAVDVALTEAPIGAGVSTVLLLGAVARLGERDVEAVNRPGLLLRFGIGILCMAVTAALVVAILTLPEPAPTLAPAAVEALPLTRLSNPVTGVLLAYRSLDTLLEAVVLMLAVVGVWSLAPDDAWAGIPGPRRPPQQNGPFSLLARVLPPIGILVGVHVFWTGANAPGGAFQGGAILAAMWILAWLAGLATPPPVSSRALRFALLIGPALFLAIGLAGFGVAEGFLAYPEGFAKPLILAIEAALTFSIVISLALLVVGPPERSTQG